MSLVSVVPQLAGHHDVSNMDSFQALGLCEEAMHFDVEVFFQDAQPKIFDISTRDTVDKVKAIAHVHFTPGTHLDDYLLGINERETLEIEFVKFFLAHVRIREDLESGEIVRVGLFRKGIHTDSTAKDKIELNADINFAERRSSVSLGLSKLAVGTPKRSSGDSSPTLGSKHSSDAPSSPSFKARTSKGKPEDEIVIVNNSRGPFASLRPLSPPLADSSGKQRVHKRYHSESILIEDPSSVSSSHTRPVLTTPTTPKNTSTSALHKLVRNRRTLSVSTDINLATDHSVTPSPLPSPPLSPAECFYVLPTVPSGFQLIPLFDKDTKNFLIERGEPRVQISSHELRITDTLKSEAWYSQYFVGHEHSNFIGNNDTHGLFIVSVMNEMPMLSVLSEDHDSPEKHGIKVRIVARTKKGDEKKKTNLKNTGMFKSKKTSHKGILQSVCPHLSGKLTRIKNPEVGNSLKNFEDRQLVKCYKFGILYCKAGQTEEEQMFSNKEGSPDWDEFLDFIGERVDLQGWTKYRAGLDVKGSSTGLQSVYTKYQNFEIMFHVSTMLPYNHIDAQQVERKRHLGNDIVVIVFKEGDQPYNPNCIKSEFNHIFAVVSKVKNMIDDGSTYYNLSVASKEGVPAFKPELHPNAVFEKGELMKEFLLCKLINGENTSYDAPSFKLKIQRTRLALLKEIECKYAS